MLHLDFMLSGELRARQSKLESEQRSRIERAKQKKEKEKALEERVRQRQLQREEDARLLRLAQQAALQKVSRTVRTRSLIPRGNWPGFGVRIKSEPPVCML